MHIWLLNSSTNEVVRTRWQTLKAGFEASGHTLDAAQNGTPDAVILCMPCNVQTAFSAWLLAKQRKAPLIIDISAYVEFNLITKFVLNRAARVIVTSDSLRQQIGLVKTAEVITDGIDDAIFTSLPAAQTDGRVDRLRSELALSPLSKAVVYVGGFTTEEAVGQLIDAARILLTRSDIVFLLVGDGPDKQRLQQLAAGMPNVQFFDEASFERRLIYHQLATLNVLLQKATARSTVPTQTYALLADGKPFVAAVSGEVAAICEHSDAGLVVEPEEPEQFARAIETLVDDPNRQASLGAAGRAFAKQHFLASHLAQRYVSLIHKIKR